MNLEVLPLAITMMVWPGIMADVVLITAAKPVNVSAAFIQACQAAHAEGTRLDEHEQLAGKHLRLRRVHRARSVLSADPYLESATCEAA